MKTKNLITSIAFCALLIGTVSANNTDKVVKETEKTSTQVEESNAPTIVGVAERSPRVWSPLWEEQENYLIGLRSEHSI